MCQIPRMQADVVRTRPKLSVMPAAPLTHMHFHASGHTYGPGVGAIFPVPCAVPFKVYSMGRAGVPVLFCYILGGPSGWASGLILSMLDHV